MERLLECKYITCAGAGLKMMCYFGVLKALERYCHNWTDHVRDNVVGITGTSAGALLALILALGLTHDEVEHIVQPFVDNARQIIPNPDLTVLLHNFGLDRGDSARRNIAQLLQLRGLSDDITLGRMYQLTRCHFSCTATNINDATNVIFDHITHPNMRVVDAVFTSACVPIMFAPVEINGDMYVDGCFTNNLPLHFPPQETLVISVMPHGRLGVKQWSDFVTSLVGVAIGNQYERKTQYVAKVKCDITVTLPPAIRDRPGMDITMGSKTLIEMNTMGYYRVVRELYPTIVYVVERIVETFIIPHVVTETTTRGCDATSAEHAPYR